LLYKPSEAVRLWLQSFKGQRLVVPKPVSGWHWVSAGGDLIEQTVRMVRRLAEGEPALPPRQTSGWMVLIYVLAAISALELLGLAIALVVSLFQ